MIGQFQQTNSTTEIKRAYSVGTQRNKSVWANTRQKVIRQFQQTNSTTEIKRAQYEEQNMKRKGRKEERTNKKKEVCLVMLCVMCV